MTTTLDTPPAVAQPAGGTAEDPLPLRRSTEIQGDILAGFKKDHTHLLFLQFTKRELAQGWLRLVQPRIATTQQVAEFNAKFSQARRNTSGDDPTTLNALWLGISFTYPGLELLIGGAPFTTKSNSDTLFAFKEGPAKRKEILGDTGTSDPEHWLFGRDDDPVHAVLTLASDVPGRLHAAMARARQELASHRIRVLFEQHGATLPGEGRGKEHFGFKDGVSEPAVRGFDPGEPNGEKEPEYKKGKPGTRLIPSGEFLIGPEHPQSPAPQAPPPPQVPAWMHNGSFQVVRRLAQDVPGWWAMLAEKLEDMKKSPNGEPTLPQHVTVEWLAARLVGRWRSGVPVCKSPDADLPSNAASGNDNDFTFADDLDGLTTPLFSHLRKTNPRQGLKSARGNGTVPERPVLDARRIMRRGTPYGMPFNPTRGPEYGADAPRGLIFICYQSDLVEQFEFMQQAWIEDPKFPAVEPTPGKDGLVSDTTVSFPMPSVNGQGGHRTVRLARFVQTQGSVYAFTPSVSAIRQLAEGTIPPDGEEVRELVLPTGTNITAADTSFRAGDVTLRMEADRLVMRDGDDVVWESDSTGSRAVMAQFTPEGRLVLHNKDNKIAWGIGNPKAGQGATLVLLAEGALVVRNAEGQDVWRLPTR